MKNLELWNMVEKTNPNYTKKANVKGNQITSIAPQYQIKQATEQFGVYGEKWGFKEMEFDYTLANIGMATFKATFYFPGGSFPIVNSVQLYKDGAKTKIDDDFAKKVETDTLTKALSKLGFNADIFLGKFEDSKYMKDLQNEFKEPEPPKIKLTIGQKVVAKHVQMGTPVSEMVKHFEMTEENIEKYSKLLEASQKITSVIE